MKQDAVALNFEHFWTASGLKAEGTSAQDGVLITAGEPGSPIPLTDGVNVCEVLQR